jgi:triphosphatase
LPAPAPVLAEPKRPPPVELDSAAPAHIGPLWRQVRKGAGTFAGLEVEARHRLRKRLKRLRYALESVQPLLKRKRGVQFLAAVRRALAALGDLNDLQVASHLYRDLAAHDASAWLAVGYLAALNPPAERSAARALQQLRALSLPWR